MRCLESPILHFGIEVHVHIHTANMPSIQRLAFRRLLGVAFWNKEHSRIRYNSPHLQMDCLRWNQIPAPMNEWVSAPFLINNEVKMLCCFSQDSRWSGNVCWGLKLLLLLPIHTTLGMGTYTAVTICHNFCEQMDDASASWVPIFPWSIVEPTKKWRQSPLAIKSCK